MKFDQLTKKKLRNFDQTPKLTENFDQLKMSSEIRSSDRFPFNRAYKFGKYNLLFLKPNFNIMFLFRANK